MNQKVKELFNSMIRDEDISVLKMSGIVIISVFVFVLFPKATFIFVVINGLAMISIFVLQLSACLLKHKRPETCRPVGEPFFSIHVPIHNEPVAVVMNTIDALVRIKYAKYEVIILDNNTADPELWQPIMEYCKGLGEKFRFIHIDNLKGYKAGALNVCYRNSGPQTDYIMVVDADYQVNPDVLSNVLKYFRDSDVGLVQFPQSYFNCSKENKYLRDEYAHFFKVYMNMANHLDCTLSTGTMSVISKNALEDIELWSSSTVTEDVNLALRLLSKGYKTTYVSQSVGKGLMPTDIGSLRTQRSRWILGNMQNLQLFMKTSKRDLTFTQCVGVLLQLTAWFNFLLVPIVSLATIGLIASVIPGDVDLLLRLSTMSIWFYLMFKLGFFILIFHREMNSLNLAMGVYSVHIGLAWEGATSWWTFFLVNKNTFKRTNKFLLGNSELNLSWYIFPATLLLSGALFVFQNKYSIGIECFLISLIFTWGVVFLNKQIRFTWKFSKAHGAGQHSSVNGYTPGSKAIVRQDEIESV